MRGSLALLTALALTACSDAAGPHHVPVLRTQLSTSSASIGDALVVTLTASNPTDTTVRLGYSSLGYVEIKQYLHANWQGGTGGGFTSVDSAIMIAGDTATLAVVGVGFSVPTANSKLAPFVTTTFEYFTLEPGMYSVRACVNVSRGYICGNGVPFTLTP